MPTLEQTRNEELPEAWQQPLSIVDDDARLGETADQPFLAHQQDPSTGALPAEPLFAGSWLRTVLDQLERLTSLESDWDGYGAPVIQPSLIIHTLNFLEATALKSAPAPAIVATNRGSIQLEWHRRGHEIDVEIAPDGSFEACSEAPDEEPRDWEGDVRAGIDPALARAIAQTAPGWRIFQ